MSLRTAPIANDAVHDVYRILRATDSFLSKSAHFLAPRVAMLVACTRDNYKLLPFGKYLLKLIKMQSEGLAKLPTNKGSKLLLTPNEPVF